MRIQPVTLCGLHARVCVLICKQRNAPRIEGLCSETLHLKKKIPRTPLSMENNTAEVLLVFKLSVCTFLETMVIKQIHVLCVLLLF